MRKKGQAIPRTVTIEMWLFLIAVGCAVWLFQTGVVTLIVQWIFTLGPLIVGFVAGVFYSTFVTTPFAIAGFIDLAALNTLPIWQVSLVGALGATLADLFLVKGVRSPLAGILVRSVVGHDVEAFKSRRRSLLARWAIGLFGGFLIAIPLPTDELGVVFFGASGLSSRQMIAIMLIADFIGVYGLLYVAQAVMGA